MSSSYRPRESAHRARALASRQFRRVEPALHDEFSDDLDEDWEEEAGEEPFGSGAGGLRRRIASEEALDTFAWTQSHRINSGFYLSNAVALTRTQRASQPHPHPEVPERSGGLEGGLQPAARSLEGSFEVAAQHLRMRGMDGMEGSVR